MGRVALVATAFCALAFAPAFADGTGLFGYPNLISNPDFETATVASDSNKGAWGYFKNGKVTASGWTGGGNAGVAYKTDTATWRPWDSVKDDYRVFIQMANGFADDSSWIEQTVTPAQSGHYVFACKYATRQQYNKGSGKIGLSVACGDTTNELAAAAFADGDWHYHYATWHLTLEAGQSYTFRLHGVQDVPDAAKDRTVLIGACSLERLPQPDRTIPGEYHLKKDEDWSAATVDLAPDARVHLDGHNLRIGLVRPNADGASPAFTDTSSSPGELRVTVPAGGELYNPGWSLEGGATLVKDGPGAFEWRGGTVAATAPILVTNGVLRLGTYQTNVFGASGTLTVRGRGQFDMCWTFSNGGQSPVFGRDFFIEGDGPDGSGAIVNNGAYNADCVSGKHFKKVVMTSDATIGGTVVRMDFRGDNVGLYGTNRTLTVKGIKLSFCNGTAAYLDCGDVVLTEGGEIEPCNDGGILHVTGTCYIDHGGILSSWASSKNTTQTLAFPIVAGEGGGTIRRTQNYYRITAPITVEAGGTLNCPTIGSAYEGAITNKAGATLSSGDNFYAMGGIFRNDGTVVNTAGNLYFGSKDDQNHPCRVENYGTIRTTGGGLYFRSENHAHGTGTFEFAGGTQTVAGDLSDFTGTLRIAGGTATLTSIGTLGGTLVLAGGTVSSSLSSVTGPVVLDVSALSAPLDFDAKGYDTLPSGKAVTVNLGDRRLVLGEQIVAWTNTPAVVFSLDADAAARGIPLVSAEDGLYFGDGSVESARATWTGAAENGAFADIRNWMCYDGDGNPLADTIPVPATALSLGADVPDGGWASFPASAQTGAIDLNGHRLGITGQGTLSLAVTNSSVATPAELRITVPAGVTFAKTASFTIGGNLTLVKDGPGTLSWNGGVMANSVALAVTGGVFKVNVGTDGTFGTGGTITVSGTGQFDFNNKIFGSNSANNRKSPARVRMFYIEGDGPDGKGAIVNNASGGLAGKHLQRVVLTGDATIGGVSRLDFRDGASSVLDGGGHTLTIKNSHCLAFCSGTYLTNCVDVVMADGGEFQPCDNFTFRISGKIRLETGGVFANWMTSGTQYFTPPFVVGEGGGIFKTDKNWFGLNSSLTVEAGNTLSCITTTPWYDGAITNETGATLNIGGDFFATGGIFRNDGTVVHTAGNLYFGSRDDQTHPCRVENNGTIRTTGGNFYFRSENHAHGAGVFEFVGGTQTVAGDLSDFTGSLRIAGGSATLTSIDTFPGTLVLKGGAIAASSSLASFTGTARIDLAGQELPLDVDDKNWFTFAAGREVFVDVGGREFQPGDRLISWTTPPANRINFTLTNGQKGVLRADANGVTYAKQQETLIIIK